MGWCLWLVVLCDFIRMGVGPSELKCKMWGV